MRQLHRLEAVVPNCTSVAISPDGRLLAAGRADGTIALVIPANGSLQGSFGGHGARVSSLAFSPDGQWLASASDDGAVRCSDTRSSEPLGVLEGLREPSGVAFSADGTQLAVACGFGHEFGPAAQAAPHAKYAYGVQLLEAPTLQPVWGSLAHTERATGVGLSSTGLYAMSSSLDGHVAVYSVGTGKVTKRENLNAPLHGAVYRPDAKRAYLPAGLPLRGAASAGGLEERPMPVFVVNGLTLEVLRPLAGHSGVPTGGVWSAAVAQGLVVTGGSDGTVRTWDPVTGSCEHAYEEHSRGVTQVAVTPDGNWIASVDEGGGLILRDLRPPEVQVRPVAAAPKKSGCMTIGALGGLLIWLAIVAVQAAGR